MIDPTYNFDTPDQLFAGGLEEWDFEPEIEVGDYEFLEELQDRYQITPSQFVEIVVQMPNPHSRKLENFSFDERPYLRQIYDSQSKRILLIAGRQVEKSTLLANRILALSCLIPHFKSLFVSPSSTQTKDFSKSRIKEALETSPDLKVWWPSELTDNVYEKKSINRSEVKLRYAFNNADRCRGISTDGVYIDEFQDILLDNIPVIEEAASHSPYRWFVYSGTPKSLDNPIQKYWDQYSTQNEWAVPCERHGTPKNPGSWHWNILGEENMQPSGLACDRCGERISAQNPHAKWVRTGNPDPKFARFEGFRISQLMVPWLPWENIWSNYNTYPRSQFYNEVLGLSFDSGQRPLTREDMLANCDAKLSMTTDAVKETIKRIGRGHIYAGVDWGQDSTNSYTVLSLGAYIDGFFRYFFVHRFTGGESSPHEQLKKIIRFVDAFNVVRVGADYGGGFFPNDELMRKYGSMRIARYQYSNPSTLMHFDPKRGIWLIHRSEVMGSFFNALKRRTVFRFPKWEEFATPYAADCLSIFSEYNERTRMTEFKKSPNTTDDTYHSMLLCFLASLPENPRPDIMIPGALVDRRMFDS